MNPAVSRWKKEAQFVEGNHLIEAYVKEEAQKGVPLNFIDTHSKLLDETGEARQDIYRPDGLHLNTVGYALWTKILHPQIVALAGAKE